MARPIPIRCGAAPRRRHAGAVEDPHAARASTRSDRRSGAAADRRSRCSSSSSALGIADQRGLGDVGDRRARPRSTRRGAIRLGTVGTASPGVELALADDGELLVRGPVVMRGYRNEPEKTAETIDADGWLHTGDIGKIDADGYVTIVDRKKELIINAAGKNMSPANIEATLKAASPLIGQAVAIGDTRPYNVGADRPRPRRAPRFAPSSRHRPVPAATLVATIAGARRRSSAAYAGEHAAVAGRADQAVRDRCRRRGSPAATS